MHQTVNSYQHIIRLFATILPKVMNIYIVFNVSDLVLAFID